MPSKSKTSNLAALSRKINSKIAWKPRNFYQEWQLAEGINIIEGVPVLEDIRAVKMTPWKRLGGNGAFVNLSKQYEVDLQLNEIPKGQSLKPEKHMYEEEIFVLEGKGRTTFWQEGKAGKTTVDWKKGGLMSVPLNSWHQHSNASKDERAVLYSATTLPFILNRFRNLDFIFSNKFTFTDRFVASPRYFKGPGTRRKLWSDEIEVNFIPDVNAVKLNEQEQKGPGFAVASFSMTENAFGGHIGEFPVGSCVRAHRHKPGAQVLIVQGEGYEYLWYEGEKPRRYEFHEGAVVCPGDWEYHQHFNTGRVPIRQLALRWFNHKYDVGHSTEGASRNEILSFEKQPEIIEEFRRELAAKGIPPSFEMASTPQLRTS